MGGIWSAAPDKTELAQPTRDIGFNRKRYMYLEECSSYIPTPYPRTLSLHSNLLHYTFSLHLFDLCSMVGVDLCSTELQMDAGGSCFLHQTHMYLPSVWLYTHHNFTACFPKPQHHRDEHTTIESSLTDQTPIADRQTHTKTKYCNSNCACALRV